MVRFTPEAMMNHDELLALLRDVASKEEPNAKIALDVMTSTDLEKFLHAGVSVSNAGPAGQHKFGSLNDVLPLVPAILGIIQATIELAGPKLKDESVTRAAFIAGMLKNEKMTRSRAEDLWDRVVKITKR